MSTGLLAVAIALGLLIVWLLLRSGETCRRCGWERGSQGCRNAHRLNLRTRAWSRREWERYQRTSRLPWWDVPSRRDRRRSR
jgi:hypothetical protein